MDQRQIVLSQLDAIIERLTCLPQEESDVGWDIARVKNWMEVFRRLRSMVEGKALPYRYKNACYMRGLDMDSICNGGIFDMVVNLDRQLRVLHADSEK